MSTFTVST